MLHWAHFRGFAPHFERPPVVRLAFPKLFSFGAAQDPQGFEPQGHEVLLKVLGLLHDLLQPDLLHPQLFFCCWLQHDLRQFWGHCCFCCPQGWGWSQGWGWALDDAHSSSWIGHWAERCEGHGDGAHGFGHFPLAQLFDGHPQDMIEWICDLEKSCEREIWKKSLKMIKLKLLSSSRASTSSSSSYLSLPISLPPENLQETKNLAPKMLPVERKDLEWWKLNFKAN